ncbi:hypothetical protein HYO14_11390 [Vibrio parahaemolyticus]|uniref:hypothetical protein n=1 Tax=Vibrio parahaemolyticus TaxID=670 RepID=UPI0004DA0476|nr:hypothetical protein [Vibrio parahaemolyticus]EGR2260993.1 hypothetical protein [Vibrio parahaemolyticus]EHK2873918.1 hypothetical protein [Vibrio parahaemolyticus]EHZ2748885.1 hypothetical protein [Vibrio parahaemolyticus]EHZ7349484.1 hypothetical protein [Vibrio parahaemolyticus]EJC6777087.1 hypothetical protein [Vibrio parahaemolyticus]
MKEIGGYFSSIEMSEFKEENSEYYDTGNSYKYQSSRVGLAMVLQQLKPKRVLLPKFICDSIVKVVASNSCEIIWYDINESFRPIIDFEDEDSILYVVNYFGFLNSILTEKNIDLSRVIIDNAQGLFIPPNEDALANIYSIRKFLPVSDGGVVYSSLSLPSYKERFSPIKKHMDIRLQYGAQAGYDDYIKAEKLFDEIKPYNMSEHSENLVNRINMKRVKQVRNANFEFLHVNLKNMNRLVLPDVLLSPLCYPFLGNKGLKIELIKNKIYIPTYWREVESRVSSESWEKELIDNLVCIPIDDRYDINDMMFILNVINNYYSN